MSEATVRGRWGGVRPYFEAAPLATFFLGISSGLCFTLIGATLTSRLAQSDIDKKTITAFTLAFLVYNLKPLWAWLVDGVRLPVIGRLGQRVSWLLFAGGLVIAAVANLARVDPATQLGATVTAAILVGIAGATYDIVIDAYRIEILKPYQLGVGSGMIQYGWRVGSVLVGAIALVLAARVGWNAAYLICAVFALPAMVVALLFGEPERHRPPTERRGMGEIAASIIGPFTEFFRRAGAGLVLVFILIHKIGDTLGQLVLRLLLDDLGFTNDEIALYDVGVGFWAYLIGIFIGGALYAQLGLKRSVLISLLLMAVSNASFALLAGAGHYPLGLAGTMAFENIASGIGSVTVVAYFSALCDLRFTAAQYALISSAASIVGRFMNVAVASDLVDAFGWAGFYWITTLVAFPGVLLFWWMSRSGLIDRSIGTAGTAGEGDARAGTSA
ncbi:MFS transporter, PAT family, beta-lactamase induction signal transducer AmpG [Sphingomonas guangdongensis]|uniref:MFS transporter, PAT family, beta-lactamase induction signal transducer AmpG n=1 Tax=Sphingomonas guangdongensis TaxID=1141890 RepID=A0A285R0V6_9SPHN|nr:MFS transporter [Sphingomonas guangdongensis]SOB87740.1 MFS transporter, PAT family, beta-lactamase induction signal transducer AmpG [Sphingomonas guangdongensis]